MPPDRKGEGSRIWYFEKKGIDVFVYVTSPRDPDKTKRLIGVPLKQKGHGKSLVEDKEKTKVISIEVSRNFKVPTEKEGKWFDQGIKLFFDDPSNFLPSRLCRTQFDFNRNPFCEEFRDDITAEQFVKKAYELIPNMVIPEDVEKGMKKRRESGEETLLLRMDPTLDLDSIDEMETPRIFVTNKERRKRLFSTQGQDELDLPELVKSIPKKRKEEKEDSNSVIRNACLGNHNINIQCLEEAEQIRKIDEKFVDHLMENMKEYVDESYQPLAVHVTNVTKEKFKETHRNGYRYEVLGGQHMMAACKRLVTTDEAFKTRRCVVYAGLDRETKMILSHRHNVTAECRHGITLKDKVVFCRNWFEVNNFTTQKEWMESCVRVQKGMSDSLKEKNIVTHLSLLPEEVYQNLLEVFERSEKAQLKGQTVNKKGRMTGFMDTIPQCKFTYARQLSDTTLDGLLIELINKERDLTSFSKECERIHKLKPIQQAFLQKTGVKNWDEAREKFPEKATRENLLQFINLNFKKSIPESFSDFVRNAKATNESEKKKTASKAEVKAVILNEDVRDITTPKFVEEFGEKLSVSLTILDPCETWTTKEMEEWLVAYKNVIIESEAKKSALVVMGSAKWIESIEKTVTTNRMFYLVDTVYVVNTFVKPTGHTRLTQCVDKLLIGFYAETCPNLTNTVRDGCFDNYIIIDKQEEREKIDEEVILHSQKPVKLMEEIIKRFSYPGELIYEPCCGTGTAAVAALELKRNCLAVEIDRSTFEAAERRIKKAVRN